MRWVLSWIYDSFSTVVRAFYIRTRIVPSNLLDEDPTIYVANHMGSYGPVTAMSSLPQPVYPWVAHQIIDSSLCPSYIEHDFVRAEMHLGPPLSVLISGMIGRICVALMRDLHAIPVYRDSRRVLETLRISVRLLEQGKRLLIFPEIPNRIVNEIVNEFDTGFINVARLFFERSARVVSFLPIAIHRGRLALRVGAPIRFNPGIPFRLEKLRIKRELVERICEMYRDLELDAGKPEIVSVT